MDKFGIFNLINSLLTPNSTENSSSTANENNQNSPLGSLLGSLLNQKNSQNQQKIDDGKGGKPAEEIKTSPKKPTPLQASMLSTMKSHDEFLRRVGSSNKKTI